MILPFKMCLAQRLSTILLLRFTFCDGWPVPDFTVALDTSTCSSTRTEGVCLPSKRKLFSGLLQHTVNNEVFPLARLSFYENLLIRQGGTGGQRGRVVSASDSQSGGPGFESRSGHLLDLCLVVPSLSSRLRL